MNNIIKVVNNPKPIKYIKDLQDGDVALDNAGDLIAKHRGRHIHIIKCGGGSDVRCTTDLYLRDDIEVQKVRIKSIEVEVL